MAIFLVKCPSCGSATELNDEREFGFCTECGAKILTEEAELFTEAPAAEGDAPAPAEAPATEAPAALAAPEAPAEEPEPPLAIPAYSGPALSNAEHLAYLTANKPQPLDSVKFTSSDECAAYVTGIHSLILELAARYEQMNHAEEATCLDYLDKAIDYCEVLDTRRLKFLAGTHEEKGRTVEDFGTFPVSKTALKDIRQAREYFVEQYNSFFKPKIAAAKAELDESKEKIKALPRLTRFYHSFCTPLMGILSAALLAVGIFAVLKTEAGWSLLNIAILVVGALLFIAWAVTSVLWIFRGRSARQLYKAADRQVNEVRTYRAKLKS